MATNFYFTNYTSSADQRLYEDLTIEAIKMYGHDVYYIPRTLNNYDPVYGADDSSSFENAYPIEMYIKSVDGFGGDGNFISKFAGLEIREQIVFTVARRRFEEDVIQYTNQLRPNEGDLIYFTMNKRLFQIKYVNKYEIFYQVGNLTTWELTCELFDYSGEDISTGVDEIDDLTTNMDMNVLSWGILTEDGLYLTDEFDNFLIQESSPIGSANNTTFPVDDSNTIQIESDEFIDFTQVDPFSEGHI
jgi:hypothetical protein